MSTSSLNRSSAMRNIAVKKTLNSSGEGKHFWTKPLCHPERLQAYAFFAIARESSRPIVSSYIVEVADYLLIIYHSMISSIIHHLSSIGLGGANPAVNTPRPSRGTRIESCDFIVLIGDS